MMRIARNVVLGLFCAIPICSHAVAYMRLDSGIVERRLKQKPVDAKAQLQMIRQQFRDAGCDPKTSREQAVDGEALPNVICTLPGTAKGTIVFSAPFYADEDEAGSGWATVAMLPLLAESLNGSSHRCTFVFVAMTRREKMSGGPAFLGALNDQAKKQIVAMVDLERLGWSAMYALDAQQQTREIHLRRGTVSQIENQQEQTPLSQLLIAAADTLKIARPESSFDPVPANDAEAFRRAQIATLIVTSPNYVKLTKFDGTEARAEQKKIDLKAYYATYNLLCVFGLHLDQAFGSSRGKAADATASEQQIGERLFKIVNGLRSGAGLSPLASDARLVDDAKQQAAGFANNKRLDDRKIDQRMAKLGLAISDASEVWFVLPEEALSDEKLILESIGDDARRSLLDPRFNVTGIAAVHRGKSYFAVANLIANAREVTAAEEEELVLKALQQSRVKSGAREFKRATSSAKLRDVACSMAKQDSLQAGIDAVIAPKVFAFASQNPAASSWVEQIARWRTTPGSTADEKFDSVTIGVCRASSVTVPGGTFWVIAELD